MSIGFGQYAAGVIALIVIGASLGLGAYWLRRWIVPEFSGALARLAELVLGTALLVTGLEIVGTAQIFDYGPIVGICVAVGGAAAYLGYSRSPRERVKPVEPPRSPLVPLLIAVAVASFTVAEWSFPSQLNLDTGMFGGDTTWYHMPFAARFAQQGSITGLHYTDPLRLAAWFYPQTHEVINGAGIVLFKSDFLSPLINLCWLSVGLLAAWCIGRPYGVGPAVLVAAALILDSGVMVITQAGEGRNDAMAIALLVAFAAFLVNGRQARVERLDEDDPSGNKLIDAGPLILASVAAGLAISVKLTMLAPVGAISVGVIIFSGRRNWRKTIGIFAGGLFATGGYWYVRNMVETGGNPLPQIGFGPLHLPRPDQLPLDPRPRFSVFHYINDPTIYRVWFFPKLDDAFGPFFPLILIAALAAALYVAVKSNNRMLRILGAAALLTAIVYIFTPLTAAGTEGEPRGFFTNTRYLIPGVILALCTVPLARPLREDKRNSLLTLYFLTGLYGATVLSTPMWYSTYLLGAALITAAFVWAPAALGYLRSRGEISRQRVIVIAAIVVLAGIVLGRRQEIQYAEQHYTRTGLFLDEGGPQAAYDWVRDQHDQRIGIAGSGEIFFGQYGYYGADLSNYVQYIGVEGPHGTYTLADTCRSFRREINAGDYDYLVISQYTQDDSEGDYSYPIRAWTRTDPALRQIIEEPAISPQPDYVYQVKGKLDPKGCSNLGPATA